MPTRREVEQRRTPERQQLALYKRQLHQAVGPQAHQLRRAVRRLQIRLELHRTVSEVE